MLFILRIFNSKPTLPILPKGWIVNYAGQEANELWTCEVVLLPNFESNSKSKVYMVTDHKSFESALEECIFKINYK